jgi:hypothetical protein
MIKKIYVYLFYKAYMWSYNGTLSSIADINACLTMSVPIYITFFSLVIILRNVVKIGTNFYVSVFVTIIVGLSIVQIHYFRYVRNKYYLKLVEKYKDREPVDSLMGYVFFLLIR